MNLLKRDKKTFIKKCKLLATMNEPYYDYDPEDILGLVKEFLSVYVPEYNMEEFGEVDISFVEKLGKGERGRFRFDKGAKIYGRKVLIHSDADLVAKIELSKERFDGFIEEYGFADAVIILFSTATHEYRHFCQLCIAKDMQSQVDIEKKYKEILKNFNLEEIKKSYETINKSKEEISLLRSFYALLNKSKTEQEFSDEDVKYLTYFTRFDEIDARTYARDVMKCFARESKIIDEDFIMPKYTMNIQPLFSDRIIKYVGDMQDITEEDILEYARKLEQHSRFVHTYETAEINEKNPEFARGFGGTEAYRRYHEALSLVIYMIAETFEEDKKNNFILGLIQTFIENGSSQALMCIEQHEILSIYLETIFKDYVQMLWENNKLTSYSIYTCKFFSEEEIKIWFERFLSKNQYLFAGSFVRKCPTEVLPTIVEVFNKKASEIQLKYKQGIVEFEEVYELLEVAKDIDIQMSFNKQIDLGLLLTGESVKPEYVTKFNSVYEGLKTMTYNLLCKQQGVHHIDGLTKSDISAMGSYARDMSDEEFIKIYGEKEFERIKQSEIDFDLRTF